VGEGEAFTHYWRVLTCRGSVARGGKNAALCREFDISRKTGYKVFSRYKDCGLEELTM
jgi:transposase